jgi:hypothetical protein
MQGRRRRAARRARRPRPRATRTTRAVTAPAATGTCQPPWRPGWTRWRDPGRGPRSAASSILNASEPTAPCCSRSPAAVCVRTGTLAVHPTASMTAKGAATLVTRSRSIFMVSATVPHQSASRKPTPAGAGNKPDRDPAPPAATLAERATRLGNHSGAISQTCSRLAGALSSHRWDIVQQRLEHAGVVDGAVASAMSGREQADCQHEPSPP